MQKNARLLYHFDNLACQLSNDVFRAVIEIVGRHHDWDFIVSLLFEMNVAKSNWSCIGRTVDFLQPQISKLR